MPLSEQRKMGYRADGVTVPDTEGEMGLLPGEHREMSHLDPPEGWTGHPANRGSVSRLLPALSSFSAAKSCLAGGQTLPGIAHWQ